MSCWFIFGFGGCRNSCLRDKILWALLRELASGPSGPAGSKGRSAADRPIVRSRCGRPPTPAVAASGLRCDVAVAETPGIGGGSHQHPTMRIPANQNTGRRLEQPNHCGRHELEYGLHRGGRKGRLAGTPYQIGSGYFPPISSSFFSESVHSSAGPPCSAKAPRTYPAYRPRQ
jgi:hypothetical protein